MTSTTKRTYRRRSEEERIADLEKRIEELKHKVESRKRPDLALLREIPKIQKRLHKFAEKASEVGRLDVYNTTVAFLAGLDRLQNPDQESLKNWNTEALEDEED